MRKQDNQALAGKAPKKTIIKNLLFPKRTWTQEEDDLLIEVVQEFGPTKWSHIARYIPNRMGKQCRERWFNHLDPNINKDRWSEEEEWRLFLGHQLFGSKWSKLTKIIPGRTDNSIKNHWNSIMKKKVQKLAQRYETQIKKCPLPDVTKTKATAWLLNLQKEGEERLVSQFDTESVKVDQNEITQPQMVLKKSSMESDELSFDHILKRLDKSDELKMRKMDSYNYDGALMESNRRNLSSSSENDPSLKSKKIQARPSLVSVQDKENIMTGGIYQDLFQQVDNIPLPPPPLLTRESSIDCIKMLGSSPFKRQE